ncbi:caspase family protein [Mucilaginibacter sp. OK283]|uniref:caspase family protein n=1 Tax=Mucilaginibacter sp. OK283 TaxID=1881049 RepID=UPI0008AF0A8E|nr:caspase family protein [Mucilaginibacter sp. OK283]SEO20230.1 Caspase domain-containing protein [Mucilaginibacter sp. OK283]
MRKALLIGIDDYSFSPLVGCIRDVEKLSMLLSRDFDETPNFTCKKLISSEVEIDILTLKEAIVELFENKTEVALFYFSGHGSEKDKYENACLVTQDAAAANSGVDLDFLLKTASESAATEVVIILDCCFSGSLGNPSFLEKMSHLREGISILTSSHENQVSMAGVNGSVFTDMVCNALEGGSADTIGLVTVAGIYSYADKLLGPWDQRPIFKCNLSKMMSLRRCKPIIPLHTLRQLPIYFNNQDDIYKLDPSYEPDADPRGHDNEKIFEDLQRFNRGSLLHPVDSEHMYYAAINSKSCILTPLGKYYWQLTKEGKI